MVQVRVPVRRCLCWLMEGHHHFGMDRFSGQWVCVRCGGDAQDAMQAGEEYQQAYTANQTDEWLRDEQQRADRAQEAARLLLPGHLAKPLKGEASPNQIILPPAVAERLARSVR